MLNYRLIQAMAVFVFSWCVVSADALLSAQSFTLKKSFPLMEESLTAIYDMDNNGQAELIIQKPSSLRFFDGKTMAAQWTIVLDSTKGEALFSESDQNISHIRDMTLWKDYNGNGVIDVVIGGGDDLGGYIRIADPQTGETMFRTSYIPGVYSLFVADTDNDDFYDIVIGRGDSVFIYSTLAKVAQGGGGSTDVKEMRHASGGGVAIVPNPAQGAMRIYGQKAMVSEVTVYAVNGEKVAVLSPKEQGVVVWNGNDDAGKKVAQGTYYLIAKMTDGTSYTETMIRR